MNRPLDYDDQTIRATPYETLSDYRSTVFPECLSTGPEPAFSMEHPEVWVTSRSLKLFLRYYENPSKRVWLKRPLKYIEEDEIRAYRAYVLPQPLQRSSFFSVANANTWVSMDHFYAFLTTLPSLENKRGRLPNYNVSPASPISPISPASDHTLVNPPPMTRARSQPGARVESVEYTRARRNSYAKERPSVHATPKKPDYQLRRRASIAVPCPPVFHRSPTAVNEDRSDLFSLSSSSISEVSSSSSTCSESTITSLPSEYKSSQTSPLTHFQLLGRPAASAMIIRRPRTSRAQLDMYEIYPNVEEWLDTYFSSAKRYHDHIPFNRFYARHQKRYAVPVESEWATEHIGRVESPVKKPRSRRSSRAKGTEEEPFSFPEEHQADLFDNEETLKAFMAMAKAASRERGITDYRW